MSALRYCGDLRIRLTYVEKRDKGPALDYTGQGLCNGQYRCHIRVADNMSNGVTVWVGAPAHLTYAVDSSEAIDATAHAALSFAADDGWPVDSYAGFHECGVWDIRRKPPQS